MSRRTARPEPSAVQTLRLFVALWPSPAIRSALAQRRDAIVWPPDAAPVADARLHVTLHFLGNVPATRLPEVVIGLQVSLRPFEVAIGAAQVWPHGLVVAPLVDTPAALRTLHAELAAALRNLQLPVEARRYQPHVTFARRAAGAQVAPAGATLRWRVVGYALVWSDAGAGYRVLARYTPHAVNLSTARQIATAQSPRARRPTAG